MAKKDKDKSDTFNNPFSGLKGLSVSDQQKTKKEKKPQTSKVPSEPPPESYSEPIDPTVQFEQAMGELGVRRTAQDDVLEKSTPNWSEDSSFESARQSSGEDVAGGSRRQARKVARRMGDPEATLDLHGVAAADVIRKLEWFLENAIFHGCRFVRIVTGKGAHSATGPVVKPLVETYLSGPGRRFVAVWVRAPGNQGGEGALLAELRSPEEVD